MPIYRNIYNTLKVSTPTNDDLAKMIYGKSTYNTRGNIRRHLTNVREKFNVAVIADQFGRYHMSIPQYRYQTEQLRILNVGKIGRPRHFS